MKHKIILTTMMVALFLLPSAVMAEVSISIGIPLPPFMMFQTSIVTVIVPGTTNVYTVAGSDEDIFFWDDWWWWFWDGHWYRSHKHDGGWAPYDRAPDFYGRLDPNWRSGLNSGTNGRYVNSFDMQPYSGTQNGAAGSWVNGLINAYNQSPLVNGGTHFMGNGGGGGNGFMGMWGGRH